MKVKKLPIGISDFKKLREENRYFIDKSLFVKEIIDEDADIVLLPRPRRFGKTLNLSMLRYFFEKTDNKKEIEKIFSGLLIEKEEIFKEHLCKYPVIYLTFKDIYALEFAGALESIKLLISKEFEKHDYLLESNAISKLQKDRFNAILNLKAKTSLFQTSLLDLSCYLYKHHKQKPVILIDEYDTPIHTAYSENYYKEIITFFRSFLGAGLKDNTNIFKGVLTGILRVARESIFSEMNNLGVYSLLSRKFSDKFGLIDDEVSILFQYYKQEKVIPNARKWYNGYIFGKNTIYNPWSIINYAANIQDGAKSYWANTSSNQIIRSLVKKSPQTVKPELYNLLKDIPITKRIEENIVFDDLLKDDVTIYSFLLFCGYLKAFEHKQVQRKNYYKLLIPNLEVKQIFEDVIIKWLEESYESYKLREMLKALVKGDIKTFEKILSDFVIETLSYFDTAKKNVEKVYQAFILGLLVNLSADYEIESDKESGFGRYDISVIPKDKSKKAIIMELKTIEPEEKKDDALASALLQIEQRKYDAAIQKRGITDIEKLGVVFDGKRVWVRSNSYQKIA